MFSPNANATPPPINPKMAAAASTNDRGQVLSLRSLKAAPVLKMRHTSIHAIIEVGSQIAS